MISQRFLKGALALTLGTVLLTGCGQDKSANPTPGRAPALPSAQKLNFNFGFFKSQAPQDRALAVQAGKENFFNASVRVAVIGVVTDFILTPPITAFGLALNTTPVLQPDGAYLWIYTWVNGAEEAQIRLRGKIMADAVNWEMRVSSNTESPAFVNELWFTGTTHRDGDQGELNFHEFHEPGKPVVARINWDSAGGTDQLTFTDLSENPGDVLTLLNANDVARITYHDAAAGQDHFITWNEKNGTGSLRVPDYNGGREACWDNHQNDVSCAPLP